MTRTIERMTKVPREQVNTGIGIVNPWGDLWTDKVFDTPEAAIRYLDAFWAEIPNVKHDPEHYRLTPVVKTVKALEPVELWKLSDYAKTDDNS